MPTTASGPSADRRSPGGGIGRYTGAALLAAALLVLSGCPNGGDGNPDATDGTSGPTCDYDDSKGPSSSVDLSIGETKTGLICPVGDEDWYAFETDGSKSILQVSLRMERKLTEVTPTYAIHEVDSSGEIGDLVGNPPSGEASKELEVEHCLEAGSYKMAVRDQGNDDSDLRRGYELTLTTAENPDDAEPNNTRQEAIELQPETPKQGYIACRGDVDWYRLDVPQDRVIRYELEADELDYQPSAALYKKGSDEAVARVTNTSSPRKKTSLDQYVIAPEGGTYYLAVSDDDGEDADASGPYTVRFELLEDSDPNEPNNDSAEATAAGSTTSCGSSWSTALDTRGTVGAPNDADWYKVPLRGCNNGIVEVTMEVETSGLSRQKKWDVQSDIQADVAMIRPDSKSSCSQDSDCRFLDGRSCQDDLDCTRFFEQCGARGKCAGASECLPSGQCGAKQVQRHYACDENFETCDPSSGEDPPPNRAAFAAPIFGDDVIYIRAGDYQSDGSAPDQIYSLQVRVRNDPDGNEPNNIFSNSAERGASPPEHRTKAKRIPIYDCTGPTQAQSGHFGADGGSSDTSDSGTSDATDSGATDSGAADSGATDSGASDTNMTVDTAVDTNQDGVADTSMDTTPADTTGDTTDGGSIDLPMGCCTNKPWVEGTIGYQNDQDWFEYRHPCPGQDCTLRIHYRVDGGPVDTAINVYQEGSTVPWTSAYDVDEKQTQPQRSGTFGGDTAQDRCFYAYHEHQDSGGVFHYGINVSDEVESKERGEVTVTNPTSRDWAPGQSYSICVEKISNKCEEPPCKIYQKGRGGCGLPKD